MIRRGLWRAARLVWWGCTLYMLNQIRVFDAQPLQPEAPVPWPLQTLQLLGFLGLFWFSTAGAVVSVLLFSESAAALRCQPRSRPGLALGCRRSAALSGGSGGSGSAALDRVAAGSGLTFLQQKSPGSARKKQIPGIFYRPIIVQNQEVVWVWTWRRRLRRCHSTTASSATTTAPAPANSGHGKLDRGTAATASSPACKEQTR